MKKETSKQRKLREEWEAIVAKHSKSLERGAKSFGLKAIKPQINENKLLPKKCSLTSEEFQSKYVGSTAPVKFMQYTGEKMVGIATMHKSNSVPVFSQESAIDISKMRRN